MVDDADERYGSRRVALSLMYDGTEFFGWQRQPKGRTVQGVVEEMLTKISGNRPATVVGAGRTDSGVHASGQVAHADVVTAYSDRDLLHALRRMSPRDLAVADLRTVSREFHARFRAWSRSYRYAIIRRPDPFRARYAWYLDLDLDERSLNDAAATFLGRHDFTPLSKHNPDTPNAECHVVECRWEPCDGGLEFHVTADRFLYGMVRLLVGIQIDVARGKRPFGDLEATLRSTGRSMQSPSAPACGLTLVSVGYPESPFA